MIRVKTGAGGIPQLLYAAARVKLVSAAALRYIGSLMTAPTYLIDPNITTLENVSEDDEDLVVRCSKVTHQR